MRLKYYLTVTRERFGDVHDAHQIIGGRGGKALLVLADRSFF
jgi:hypothetical protein